VQLSQHDLSQRDAEASAALNPTQPQGLAEKLLADLKRAHERLDQAPHNRSRLPSSQAPWERSAGHRSDPADQDPSESVSQQPSPAPAASSADDTDAPADPADASEHSSSDPRLGAADAGTAPKRPGQRPGAPGHGRTRRFAITQVVEHHPTHCARCDSALQGTAPGACHQAHCVLDLGDLAKARAYWDTGEPADKAGAYAIQGLGALFVEHLCGSYSGVVGLPLFETAALLGGVGLELPARG
jgi:hypothetical protein